MATTVTTRNPRFQIKLIPQAGQALTLTALDNVVTSITVNKRMGEAAGTFQLALVPRIPLALTQGPNGVGRWDDLIQPMDWIEIYMWAPGTATAEGFAPAPVKGTPVLRGFVDRVGATFGIAGGAPQRTVVITGRDYGKLLLTTKMWFVDANLQLPEIYETLIAAYRKTFTPDETPDTIPPEHPKGQDRHGPVYTPSTLLKVIFDKFYKPQEDVIVGDNYGTAFIQPNTALSVPRLAFKITVDRQEKALETFNPITNSPTWQLFSDFWTIMRSYQHHPWRELYVEEGRLEPELRFRPTPWLAFNGDPVQPLFPAGSEETAVALASTGADEHDIDQDEIIQGALFRADADAYNLFATYPEMYQGLIAAAKQFGTGLEGSFLEPMWRRNPILLGINPHLQHSQPTFAGDTWTSYRDFGVRLFERQTPYHDVPMNAAYAEVVAQQSKQRIQGAESNKRLEAAYGHGTRLEQGSMQIRGRTDIRIGDYVHVPDMEAAGNRNRARLYVEGATYYLEVGTQDTSGRFVTTLHLTRGRGHMVRALGGTP